LFPLGEGAQFRHESGIALGLEREVGAVPGVPCCGEGGDHGRVGFRHAARVSNGAGELALGIFAQVM
jgi:hypothetical protein